MRTISIGSFCVFLFCVNGQRIAPGVPPQQYANQQVPVHNAVPNQPVMHQQHVPQQQIQQPVHQQVPQQQIHQQQVPVVQQQVQGQVPVQHVQQGVPVHHGHDGKPILNAANIAHEKEHIQEHMDIPMDTSKMSEQELQFHYFKMHDADNNDKLDGCELIKSLIHWHEQGNRDPNKPYAGDKIFMDEELVKLIDPILAMDDVNSDGFISYPEFVQAQQKASRGPNQN